MGGRPDGQDGGDDEADRTDEVRPPAHVFEGLGIDRAEGRDQGGDVEGERAEELDRRRPPIVPGVFRGPTAGLPAAGQPELGEAGDGEEDRAEEVGDVVGRDVDQPEVAGR